MDYQPINIFLANDHSLMREGAKTLIHQNSGMQVIGEAGSFTEIYERLDGSITDILITDDQMPGGDFPENLAKIKEKWPKLKVIVMSMFPPETEHLKVVKHLLDGYLHTLSDEAVSDFKIVIKGLDGTN